LSNCDQEVAHQICDTFLRQIIREQEASVTLKSIPSITASIGLVTMIPDSDSTAMTLLNKADTLLYQAKAFGRNRIEMELNSCDQNLV
jgi:diguanylate cyclase (GGDEF)-like protein